MDESVIRRAQGRQKSSALWMYATNLGASRATPDTCAQACESVEGRGVWWGRNALRARTMPSPITYMSSYIACPRSVQPLCLHTYFFWQFSYITRLTDSTDYLPVSLCFDGIKESPFVIFYIDGHHNWQVIFLSFYIVLDHSLFYLLIDTVRVV